MIYNQVGPPRRGEKGKCNDQSPAILLSNLAPNISNNNVFVTPTFILDRKESEWYCPSLVQKIENANNPEIICTKHSLH